MRQPILPGIWELNIYLWQQSFQYLWSTQLFSSVKLITCFHEFSKYKFYEFFHQICITYSLFQKCSKLTNTPIRNLFPFSSEKYWWKNLWKHVVKSIIVGVLGNVATICVILKNKYMHTPTNVYLANLAISDLLTHLVGKLFLLITFFC